MLRFERSRCSDPAVHDRPISALGIDDQCEALVEAQRADHDQPISANNRRLLEPLGYVPPAEFEAAYYAKQSDPAIVVGFN
jgi:hypothetical protein